VQSVSIAFEGFLNASAIPLSIKAINAEGD